MTSIVAEIRNAHKKNGLVGAIRVLRQNYQSGVDVPMLLPDARDIADSLCRPYVTNDTATLRAIADAVAANMCNGPSAVANAVFYILQDAGFNWELRRK